MVEIIVAADEFSSIEIDIYRNTVPEYPDTDEQVRLPLHQAEFGSSILGNSSPFEVNASATVWGVLPATGEIIRVSPSTGNILESFQAPGALLPSHTNIGLALAERGSTLLYINSDVDPDKVHRIDTATGQVRSVETISSTGLIDGLGFDPVRNDNSAGGQILLISDSNELTGVAPFLSADGHSVTEVTDEFDQGSPHLTDLEYLLQFDFVIWGASGDGFGDIHDIAVYQTLESYIQSGGNLLATGYDSLADPTDDAMAELIRSTTAVDVQSVDSFTTRNVDHFILNGPIGDFRDEEVDPIYDDFDGATADTSRGAIALADHLGGYHAIIYTPINGGGSVGYWTGGDAGQSASDGKTDWKTPGTSVDILRNWAAGVVISGEPTLFVGESNSQIRRQVGYSGPITNGWATGKPIGGLAGDGRLRQFGYFSDGSIHEYDLFDDQDAFLSTLPSPATNVEGMAFDGSVLYVSTGSGELYSLDPDTGSILMSTDVLLGGLYGLAAGGDPVIPNFVTLPDIDSYTLSLISGRKIDIVLDGNSRDFSSATVELLSPDGSVLATATDQPVQSSVTNYDLGILDFVVPASGEYTIRVISEVEGVYGLVVTEALFDTEPNDSVTGLRQLEVSESTVGYLETDQQRDSYLVQLTAGQAILLSTSTPFDSTSSSPGNTINPSMRVLSSVGEELAVNLDDKDGKNAQLVFTAPTSGDYIFEVASQGGKGEYLLDTQFVGGTTVVGRHIFYNNSKFDANNAAHTTADDVSIASKSALLPGQTASLDNYTNYVQGINGIMIDVFGLSQPQNIGPSDFRFRIGNDSNVESWKSLTTTAVFSVREGAGVGGSDRITITWPNRTIVGQWLQVVVLDTNRTGLSQPDVHYWGNAPGDVGNSPLNAFVDATDFAAIRDNPTSFLTPASLDSNFDINRDTLIDGTDISIVRDNVTTFANSLQLLTVPLSVSVGGASVSNNEGAARESLETTAARVSHDVDLLFGSALNQTDELAFDSQIASQDGLLTRDARDAAFDDEEDFPFGAFFIP